MTTCYQVSYARIDKDTFATRVLQVCLQMCVKVTHGQTHLSVIKTLMVCHVQAVM